jgi:hypothetical protein
VGDVKRFLNRLLGLPLKVGGSCEWLLEQGNQSLFNSELCFGTKLIRPLS